MQLTFLKSFHGLLHTIQPLLVPICFVTAWALVLLTVWSLFSSIRDGVANAKRMHQIPCTNCCFFTGDYRLKCAVHPKVALSEAAIDCPDQRSKPGFFYG